MTKKQELRSHCHQSCDMSGSQGSYIDQRKISFHTKSLGWPSVQDGIWIVGRHANWHSKQKKQNIGKNNAEMI